jgi:hypothetical protein
LSPIIATLYAIISKIQTFNIKIQKNKYERQLEEIEQLKNSKRITTRLTQTAKEIIKDDQIIELD